jgi:DNA-directed RNA polymerase subunit RPC12/RpoP
MRTVARPTPIEIDCTTCGYVLRPHRAQAGGIIICPSCEARLFVPEPPPSGQATALPKAPTIAGLFNNATYRWVT